MKKIKGWWVRIKNNPRVMQSISVVALILLVAGGIWGWKKHQEKINPVGVYEVAVVLRDQTAAKAEEDQASSLKRGDVLAVRSEGHQWSHTEEISYLILKIKMHKKVSENLLAPEEVETGEKDEQGEKVKKIVTARKYHIDMSKIGFDGDQVISGQPLLDKVFGEEVVAEK